jgi:ankyrin repeat protein
MSDHQADSTLTLDSEYVKTGGGLVKLRTGSQSSFESSGSSFFVVVKNHDETGTLPSLLRKIFKASRINLIFTIYHRLVVRMLTISDLSGTSTNATKATKVAKAAKATAAAEQKDSTNNTSYNIQDVWIARWFDNTERILISSQLLAPTSIALDDVLRRMLDRILESHPDFKLLTALEQTRRATIVQFFIDTLYERPQRRSSIIQRCVATTKLSSMAVGYTLSMSSRNHSESQDDSHDGLFDPALFLSLDDAEDARYAVNDPRRDGTFAKLDAAHSSGHHHLLASVPPLHVAVLMGSVIAVQLFDRTLQHIQVDVDALGNSAFHIFSMVQHTNTNESTSMESTIAMGEALMSTRSAPLIDAPNMHGQSPLHLAALGGVRDVLCWLLEQGIQVDTGTLRYLANPTSLTVQEATKKKSTVTIATTAIATATTAAAATSRQQRSKSSLIIRDLRRHDHRFGDEGPSWPYKSETFAPNYRMIHVFIESDKKRPRIGYPIYREALDASWTAVSIDTTTSATVKSPRTLLRLAQESCNMANTFKCIAPLSTLSSSPRNADSATRRSRDEDTLASSNHLNIDSHASSPRLDVHELMLKFCIKNNDLVGVMSSINRGASVRLLEAFCLENEQRAFLQKNQGIDSSDTWLPLHSATSQSNPELARLLIARGASVKLTSRLDGTTVLHQVAMGSKQFSEIGFSHQQRHNRAAASRSRTLSKEDIADLMHERRRLHLIEQVHRNRAMDTARALLELGADADALDGRGATPLHIAVLRNDYVYAKLLVSYGARPGLMKGRGDLNDLVRGGGCLPSPLHTAVASNHMLCLRAMLQNVGSGGLATSRKYQLGDDIDQPTEKVDTPTKVRNRKSTNEDVGSRRKRAQTIDELPTSSIDSKGNTALTVAMVKLNCAAVGILANSGARFDQGKESPISKLGHVYLNSHRRGSKGFNELIAETSLRLLALCVSNGATPMIEERATFDRIRRESEDATERLSRALELVEARDYLQVKYMRENCGANATVPLLFWVDPGKKCWGANCLEQGLGENQELRHCTSCGLQYCRNCCATGQKWTYGEGIVTVTGDRFKSCLCTACSMY